MSLLKDENGEYSWNENGEGEDVTFKVYENGDDISNVRGGLLAIQYGHNLPNNIPDSIYALLLPDDFSQSLDSLPQHVKILFLFNVKIQVNSVPKSINTIYFLKGFSQRLNNQVIPDHIKTIYLGDTVHPLESNSVSNPSSTTVYKMLSHKHQIPIPHNHY